MEWSAEGEENQKQMRLTRGKIIRRASLVGIVGNAFLAVAKISAGLLSGSYALIGDGIDSTSDIIGSVISLYTVSIISKPPDRNHPYGHSRAETLATSLLAFIMFFVGFELLRTSFSHLFEEEGRVVPSSLALIVTGVSIVGKFFLAFYLKQKGRKIESVMLIANGKNMQNDIVISSGVLVGLGVTLITGISLIDSIIAIAISLYILYTALTIFVEINTELMDSVKEKEVYQTIFQAVHDTRGAVNPHRTRVRKLASFYVIDLDIEVDGNITVTEAHEIAVEAEKNIKEKLDNVFDIMVHVEPKGNEEDEQYGLSHGEERRIEGKDKKKN